MVLKNLNYIKYSHNVKYVVFSIFLISGFFNFIRYIRYMNIGIIGRALMSYIIYSGIVFIIIYAIFKIFNIENNIAELELVRRINEIYIPKVSYLGWSRHEDVGVFFIDPEKNTFWFCGKQTNYALYIDSLFNAESKKGEKNTYRLTRIIKEENEVNEFIIYPSDLTFE